MTGIFVEGFDVTDRVRGEENQKLLLQELSHRVKNLFAVSIGMVRLSARTAASPKDMAQALTPRLAALERANDLIRPGLTGVHSGEATTIERLIRAILLPYLDDRAGLIELSGESVAVSGPAVTGLALVFHEMATNAAKYGALSTPEGTLAIRWWVDGQDLHCRWTEAGGPPIVAAPKKSGFGTILVERSVSGQLNGILRTEWRPEGLIAHLQRQWTA